MFQIEGIQLYLCISLVIYRYLNILAVNISINQNIIGLVGKNDTHLTCSFINGLKKNLINTAFIARNKNKIFVKNEPVAVFSPDKEAMLTPSGDYLSGRVTLTNITKVSTSATLRFNYLKCEDDKDYMCIAHYVNEFGVISFESEPTRILVKAFPSMPDSISYVLFESIEIEKEDNSSANFPNNRNNTSLSTNRNRRVSFFTLLTETVTLTHMQTTQKSVPSFREGDTVQFTCTGNIGKPPGRFVWQIIPQQGDPIVYYNETTVVVDKIPDICSLRGTSNLTVEITAEYFKAKVQCFEESQADVLGMFVETDPLYVSYTVRHINITKQPNQPQYDHKTPTITLTCTGDGNPKPTYQWFRQENRRSIISSTNLYIIEDVIQNNSGVYICEAYNTLEDVKYYSNNSVQIEIVDEVWSSKESKSLKISAVYAVCVIPIICAVVIGALILRKYLHNRPKKKMREQNCCQKLMDCSMSCYGRAVNPVTNSTIPLTELEAVSDDNKERENHSRSREEKTLETTVDVNPILEATSDSIYADPCDEIKLGHVSDETDIDINV